VKATRAGDNSLNQRTQMVTPDGRTITYGYNTTNRLSQISSAIGIFNISYDNAGRRTSLGYPNLVTTTYTYNSSGFLTNLLARYNQQTTIDSFAYTPDGMGNRTSMTDLAGVHNYTYDNIYQLTQATHPNISTEVFTFDAVGNRLSSEGQAPSLGRSTDYTYDFENRLIEVNYPGMVAQYKYDPFGRRIEKNVNNTITRYVYDGPNIVTEYDGTWNVTARYIHTLAIDDPLTVTQGTNTFYYHKDGLGSVVNLTDGAGNVMKGYTYKSFGEIYAETGALVQPFTFTGREYDPESGLYYYRGRYYDPRVGRFLTKDPIELAEGDVNLYRYVINNPINLIDPYGLHERSYWHLHSTNDAGYYALTIPFIGPIIYYPPYDRLSPIEQESIDYHELLHKKYGPFMSEREVWRKEIEFIQKQIDQLPADDPNKAILENWKKLNEEKWNEKYGNPCK